MSCYEFNPEKNELYPPRFIGNCWRSCPLGDRAFPDSLGDALLFVQTTETDSSLAIAAATVDNDPETHGKTLLFFVGRFHSCDCGRKHGSVMAGEPAFVNNSEFISSNFLPVLA